MKREENISHAVSDTARRQAVLWEVRLRDSDTDADPGVLHAFEHWLQQQPCLQQVGLPADLTTLAPPGQEISLVHCNGSHRTVNVVFTPDRIYLDYCH